ncbi:MAG: hypothetical protein KKB50_09480 [Planctomycetes bacterium]|nr:hypothetical protein [Planctomycetota bacterium]
MRSATSLGLLLICLAPFACRTTGPPVSPPPVNAVLSDSMTTYGDADRGHRGYPSDTRLTARCRSSDTFAKRKRGNWVTEWYVVRCDVVSVDRGTWPDAELSFICSARFPTPESGITISFVWLYPPGKVWIFELDTGRHPALIVDRYEPPNRDPEAAVTEEQGRAVDAP